MAHQNKIPLGIPAHTEFAFAVTRVIFIRSAGRLPKKGRQKGRTTGRAAVKGAEL
jgi:hypothetical protein